MRSLGIAAAETLLAVLWNLLLSAVGGLALMWMLATVHAEAASVPALGYFTSLLAVAIGRIVYVCLSTGSPGDPDWTKEQP